MKRFLSRKFITAAAGIAAGLFIVLGVDENTVSTVAGAVISAASLITYIVTEGKIDAAGVSGKADGDRDES